MGENPHSTVSQEPERVAVRRKLHRNLYTRGSHFLSISPRGWRFLTFSEWRREGLEHFHPVFKVNLPIICPIIQNRYIKCLGNACITVVMFHFPVLYSVITVT